MLRIALVDDQRLFRDAFRSLVAAEPDVELVGEAGSAEEAYEVVGTTRPDLVLLDAALPDPLGRTTTRELLRRAPRCKVMLLGPRGGESAAAGALASGALGYALRDQSAEVLFDAMRRVASGQQYVPPGVAAGSGRRATAAAIDAAPPIPSLSRREREVFVRLARGDDNDDIASSFGISVKTVETHRSRVLKKLGVHSLGALVRVAARHGLLEI